jgi:2-dehydro-3-deoxyphosphogluconate aldolase/(4S)-4-hydroxy-2-oxoglutarate aldolase
MTNDDLKKTLFDKGIVAVLEIEDENDAVPVCNALLKGGVSAIELALRTPAALPSIKRIAAELPAMCIGVGTVIQAGQAKAAKEAGGVFGLAPGFNAAIMQEALDCGLPFIPGITTASELEAAVALGARVLKFFPAEPSGGAAYLKSLNNPYNYKGLSYIPLGGITEENLGSYANLPCVAAIGGTWIAKRDAIKAKKWDDISHRAERAVRIWKAFR